MWYDYVGTWLVGFGVGAALCAVIEYLRERRSKR